jgi:Tol biopolymer transport system component
MQWSRKHSIAFFLLCFAFFASFLYLRRFGPIPTIQMLPAEGNLIAFYAVTFPSPFTREGGLFLLDTDTRKIVRWTPGGSGVGGARITWLDNREQLLLDGDLNGQSGLFTISTDGTIQEISLKPDNSADHALSHDGHYLAFRRMGDIFVQDLRTNEIRQITHTDTFEIWPRWSPSDRALVFSSSEEFHVIYRVNLDELESFPLTAEIRGNNFNARWSPDGTMIAFANRRMRDDPAALWIMNQDGSNARVIVPPHPSGKYTRGVGDFAWSSDSRQIVFASGRDGFCYITVGYEAFECAESIYLINIDGTGLKRLTHRWQVATSLTWVR